MNEWRSLMFENREKRPRDRDGGWEVTFWRRECVRSCSSLKKEAYEKRKKKGKSYSIRWWRKRFNLQCEENEDLRPNTRVVFQGIGTKSLECSEYDQDTRPAVVKRKWKMDEEFVQAT